MFRYATDCCPKPHFLMVCDHPKCAQVVRMEVPPNEPLDKVQGGFVATAVQSGWGIGLDAQLCPAHFQKQKQSQQAQKLIQVASAMPGVLSGKSAS